MSSMAVSLSEAASACKAKMQAAGVGEACIRAFLSQHAVISKGGTGDIPEKCISPVESLDSLDNITLTADNSILQNVVLMKLNGGLGTSMGLHSAKTLLPVKDGKNFLDFTVQQVEHLRKAYSDHFRFMLMNSFSTSSDTKEYLKKYAWLHDTFDAEVEVIQNRVPKISQETLFPVTYESDPSCEWAPPGHGDLYTALFGSGKLDDLLRSGYQYMFVSNGDNLGATLDVRLLSYMKKHNLDFLMEVCRRTESDKKGGHLAYQTESLEDNVAAPSPRRLILRESAQCPKEDEASFQDIEKHRFFNTNNLWVNLVSLKKTMESHNGVLPLPVIRNAKTVNPVDGNSTKVYQLETAMGAAIGLFKNAAAVLVPRERFAPVKTCSDLFALRSDAYTVTKDQRLVLCEDRAGKPPTIDLDSKHYKLISGLETLLKAGVPSLRQCGKLTIQGPVLFEKDVVIKGEVTIRNKKEEPITIQQNRVLNNEVVES